MTEKAYWLPQRMVLWRGQMADELGVLSITQQQAADALGVSRRTYIGWETGESPINRRVAFACNFIRQNLSELVQTLPSAAAAEASPGELLGLLNDVEKVQTHVAGDLIVPTDDLFQESATTGQTTISGKKFQVADRPVMEYSSGLAVTSKE